MSQATDTTEKSSFLITEDREKKLWNLLDQYRCTYRMDFLPAIRWLREQGEQLDVSDILYLQQRFGLNHGCLSLPFSVARFYSQLLYSRKASRVLDPTGAEGLLGAWLSLKEYIQEIDVVISNADAEELISPLDLPSLTLHIGNVASVREKLAAKYDAIVSIPPIGMRSQHQTFQTIDGSKIELDDEPSLLLIANMADFLAQDGMLAFIVSPRFEWDKKTNSVRSNLEKFGLYLSALLKFRPGAFHETSLALDLAIIEKVDHRGLFVAEIPEDDKGQDELITRLWKRQKGPIPSQGWIVTDDQFLGLQALEATERARRLALSKGLDPVPFRKAVIKINVPKRRGTDFERCEERPDAIYLPEMAATKARTRQGDLPEKLKSYFQLIVDPEVVLPDYLAEMMNTPIGYAIREASMRGAVIPRIDRSILATSTLYLPPLIEQRRAIEALSSIQNLRSELAELESEVWEKPRKVSKVIESLSKVNHEERFEEWLESLPFPLASTLKTYHAADKTEKEKYERLLDFFEILARFCAIIHLSAFMKNRVNRETLKRELAILMNELPFSFEESTFGLWVAVVGFFAKKLRLMLSGKSEEQAFAQELYVTRDSRPLEVLSSKKLVSLLQNANFYRNRVAHSSFASTDEKSIELHTALKQNLAAFREIVGTSFLQYQLIQPGETDILEGPIFQCRITRVMGSNPQFDHQIVDLKTLPIKGDLYLYNPGHDEILKICPLIQIKSKPQPVAYFYNRIENMKIHIVSYPDLSDEIDVNDSIKKLLTDLNSKEKF